MDKYLQFFEPIEETLRQIPQRLHKHVEIEARISKKLINKQSVERLLEHATWKRTTYTERRKISKFHRKCTYRKRDDEVICKSSITKTEINELWCTVHISTEVPIPSMSHALSGVQPVEITRYTLVLENSISVDVICDDQEYRVEVEFLDTPDFEKMVRTVRTVCRILQGSSRFVKYYDWQTVLHVASTQYGPFCIEKGSYQKPWTMVTKDLLEIAKDPKSWTVTPKVDGVRRFLVVIGNRMFSVGIMGDVRFEATLDSTHDIAVLDAEFTSIYYIFDIAVDESVYCGKDEYRHERIHKYVPLNEKFVVKPYESFASFDALAGLYATFSDTYKMDGLIFAHTTKGYMQHVSKWKMCTTVDLEVCTESDGSQTLLTSDDHTVENEWNSGAYDELCYGVWEFKKVGQTLVATKPRPDKPRANSRDIVSRNLRDAVSGEIFSGKGCYLMRKYHNREKERMIRKANDAGAKILDVGTGQGGDIMKWAKASHVYCVEPSAASLEEMKKRIPAFMQDKITLFNLPLRDIDPSAVPERIDIFTVFFCMNQFEDDDWTALESLVKSRGSKHRRLLAIAMTDPVTSDNECFTIVNLLDHYDISIHNTRIVNIRERAVDPKKLTAIMTRCNMKKVYQQAMDKYTFMTKHERKLSSMYTMFVYK